ncbi:MAG: serine hydroxymethyltransferase [Bifidobacteriaceae bacterium]|jgi:glycine hydroxymethyltransferase|nr:serine hydroxymethyltransferase [Bifidobacteriaceae bacterium]
MKQGIINQTIEAADPLIAAVIEGELERQQNGLEMIASENFVPLSILQAQGSVLTNKYAEGYPEKRYYNGCEQVDIAENLAISRAKQLFSAQEANVQPHSGASANAAVLQAMIKPGEKILGMDLASGGHLTHGMKLNFSGIFYKTSSYGVDPKTYLIDYDNIRSIAKKEKPQIIIAGWSAYPRQIDFSAYKQIADEVGAKLWCDMAHFAGLAAAGFHPTPAPYCDVVSSTAHKTLGGPRSGFILCKKEYIKRINSAVFPGTQGGPLMHVVAGKAVAFKIASSPEFKNRIERTLQGAKIIAQRLLEPDCKAKNINVLTGGTDVHLLLVSLLGSNLSGAKAADLLQKVGITINKNSIPFDPAPPSITSGIRIGTSALATRGFDIKEFTQVADIIAETLIKGDQANFTKIKKQIKLLTEQFPLYQELNKI